MDNFEKIAMEALFWIGFALILVPIFYQEMMLFTILVSFGLMFFTVAKEGFSLAKGKTAMETIKKNEIPLLHKCIGVIALFLAALYIYTDGDAIYNSIQNFFAWLVSSSSVSALALITLGALFAFLALFQPSKKFLRKVGILRKKERYTLRFFKKTIKRKCKLLAYSIRNFSFANMFKPGKKKKKKKQHELKISHSMAFADKFLAVLFIIVITAILVLNKKGMFSVQNPVQRGILIAIFILFAIVVGFSAYSRRHVAEPEPESKTDGVHIEKIKIQAVAKAGKYQTDIDRLYRTINSANIVTITQAATMFRITKEQAEEWGKILESHGLIELRYPAIGELQLCKKKLKTTE